MSNPSQLIFSLDELLNTNDGINDTFDGEDNQEPLPSESQLGLQLNNIPLKALSISAIKQLTDNLNVEQLITTDDGLARDHRGLSQQMGFSYVELENFRRNSNPSKVMLDSYKSKHPSSNINDLIRFLEKIERYDVIDDLKPNLEETILNQQAICSRQTLSVEPTLSLPLSQSRYDAFVCYADEDVQFVYKLIHILESFNISILTKEKLLAGHIEFDAITESINQHCERTIIILSPQFLKSSKCVFQSKFAYALAYEKDKINMGKIIPVIYEPCVLPQTISVMTKVDLTYNSNCPQQLIWPLKRLIASLIDNSSTSLNNTKGRDPSPCHVKIDIDTNMASSLHADKLGYLDYEISGLKMEDNSQLAAHHIDNSDLSRQIDINSLGQKSEND